MKRPASKDSDPAGVAASLGGQEALLLEAVVNASPAAIFTLDPEGRVLSWNRAATEMFGWSAQEAIGRLPPILGEGQRSEFEALRARVLAGEAFADLELLRWRRDGSPISISLSTAPIRDPEGEVVGIMAVALDLSPRRRVERALQESEARSRAVVECLPIPTFTWQRVGDDFVLVSYNTAAREITGGGVAQWVGKPAKVLYADAPDILADFERCYVEKRPLEREMQYRYRTKGVTRTLVVTYGYVPPDLVIAHTQDVTALRQAEERLRIAQRLEAVGRLAGGVAHDFNNLLTVIEGYTGFVLEGLHERDPLREDLQEAQKAIQSAAELTQQLLAFGRKQLLAPRVFNINHAIGELRRILGRLLGEHIEVQLRLAEGLGNVLADPSQMEQVIVNLALNARDAMPEGGKVIIETANVQLAAGKGGALLGGEPCLGGAPRLDGAGLDGGAPLLDGDPLLGMPPGAYVLLSVTDSGVGMDAETRERIFEPFFTTKGKGTGLGLATVYGIVTQSRGHLWVTSRPGEGSRFLVILPRVEAEPKPKEEAALALSAAARGTETVLVVDDGEVVRRLAGRILQHAGYRVILASGPGEALLLAEKRAGDIDLLLTDVVMPEMSGRQLAERLLASMPTLKVLFMSGYTGGDIEQAGVLAPGTHFLPKPFTAPVLARKVRAVLDSPPGEGARHGA